MHITGKSMYNLCHCFLGENQWFSKMLNLAYITKHLSGYIYEDKSMNNYANEVKNGLWRFRTPYLI